LKPAARRLVLACILSVGVVPVRLAGSGVGKPGSQPSESKASKKGKNNQKRVNGHVLGLRANLAGADLSHQDLRWVDLRYANLTAANLEGADLTGADLSHANLDRTVLFGAKLEGTRLLEASVQATIGGDFSLALPITPNIVRASH
jgi:uncharacterized protein YjbI with pentapeptide repeats